MDGGWDEDTRGVGFSEGEGGGGEEESGVFEGDDGGGVCGGVGEEVEGVVGDGEKCVGGWGLGGMGDSGRKVEDKMDAPSRTATVEERLWFEKEIFNPRRWIVLLKKR